MATFALKLPPELLEQLQAMAGRLRCNRGALARALLIRGLEQLEQATTKGVA
jgi:predicted transcriptional regulator